MVFCDMFTGGSFPKMFYLILSILPTFKTTSTATSGLKTKQAYLTKTHRYTSRAVDCLFTPGRPFDLKAHFSTTISGRRPFQKEVFNAQSYAALDSSRSLPRISPLIRELSVFLGADQLCTECEPVTSLPRIGAAFPVMSLHFSAL